MTVTETRIKIKTYSTKPWPDWFRGRTSTISCEQ